jgi:DNA-directed RNA polymerase subunit M/transcription elongation factor TFIIS
MIKFCPECGNLLRKKFCPCGYNAPADKKVIKDGVIQIWQPPTPNIIYCKITGTPLEKLKKGLNKGIYPDKLKEIKIKLKKHLFSCRDCVYYREDVIHCQLKNKFLKKDSICRSFEPYANIV